MTTPKDPSAAQTASLESRSSAPTASPPASRAGPESAPQAKTPHEIMLQQAHDDVQMPLAHPAHQVYFRAGLIACREYMARFVEAQDPAIAVSIRANWWPALGQDMGEPRLIEWGELTDGEYGEPGFRCKKPSEFSPTLEALPIALGFLNGHMTAATMPSAPSLPPAMVDTPNWASLAEHIKRVGPCVNFRICIQGGRWATVSSKVLDAEPTVIFGHDIAVSILDSIAAANAKLEAESKTLEEAMQRIADRVCERNDAIERAEAAEQRAATLQQEVERLREHAEAMATALRMPEGYTQPRLIEAYEQYKAALRQTGAAMIQLKFHELSTRQQAQARARFLDAGSPRDNYWYELSFTNDILCRNREIPEPGDVLDEGLD